MATAAVTSLDDTRRHKPRADAWQERGEERRERGKRHNEATASTAVREMHLKFLLHTSRRRITNLSSAVCLCVCVCVGVCVSVCVLDTLKHFNFE